MVIIVCILAFLLFNRRKKKWKLSKEKLAEIIKTRGRIELAEASKVTGVKLSKIEKLFSDLVNDNSVAEGIFVNECKEFVAGSFMVEWVLKTGKFSFADFGLKFGTTENEAKEVITNLLNKKKVNGTFTLDGKSFVTEGCLMDEIGRNNA